jgi:hypothetical protein
MTPNPASMRSFERLMLLLFAALLVAIVTALWLVGSWTVVIGMGVFAFLCAAAAVGGLYFDGEP